MLFAWRLRAPRSRAVMGCQYSVGRSTRRLLAEQLESRLALASVPVAVDVLEEESLGVYLAQTVEMGPVAPPATDPAPSATPTDVSGEFAPAMVDAALAAVRYETAPEGDAMFNRSPTFIHFDFQRTSLGLRFFGQITDDDPATCYIKLDGMISVSRVPVNADGTFSVVVPDPGGFGYVNAMAYDYYGMSSVMTGVYVF